MDNGQRAVGFLDLPPELREGIYKLVLNPRCIGKDQYKDFAKILRLNKQIYQESRWHLHRHAKSLELPLRDGISQYGLPFRRPKTKYKTFTYDRPDPPTYYDPHHPYYAGPPTKGRRKNAKYETYNRKEGKGNSRSMPS
jgi:hypothetical protein